MNKKPAHPYVLFSVFFAVAVALLYFEAQKYSLFFIFPWINIVMHVLGGFAVGYMSLFLFRTQKFAHKIISTGICALLVGGAWETLERVGNEYAPAVVQFGGVGDTVLDIVCAILGAVFITAIYYHHE